MLFRSIKSRAEVGLHFNVISATNINIIWGLKRWSDWRFLASNWDSFDIYRTIHPNYWHYDFLTSNCCISTTINSIIKIVANLNNLSCVFYLFLYLLKKIYFYFFIEYLIIRSFLLRYHSLRLINEENIKKDNKRLIWFNKFMEKIKFNINYKILKLFLLSQIFLYTKNLYIFFFTFYRILKYPFRFHSEKPNNR